MAQISAIRKVSAGRGKAAILFALALTLAPALSAQTIEKQWTRQEGTVSDEINHGVVTDSSGCVYMAGFTYGGLNGSTNQGGADIFIIKYDRLGGRLFTKQRGTASADSCTGVAYDPAGYLYIIGTTAGSLDGGTNQGGNDMVLIKYDTAGDWQWTRQFGSGGNDSGLGVCVGKSGNIYVSGSTGGALDGANQGGLDLFVTKYSTDGVKQWTKQLGSAADDVSYAVAIDSAENVYATGYTKGGLDGANQGGEDIFLVKYTSNSIKEWTKQLGGAGDERGYGAAADELGEIFVTGYTFSDLDGNTSNGGNDYYLAKYNEAGTKQWTQQYGTGLNDWAYPIVMDPAGNLYISGATYGDMGGFTNQGSYDMFLVKCASTTGAILWTQELGSGSDDYGYGVASDYEGNIFVTGYTDGDLDGNINQGSYDAFLIRYATNTAPTLSWTGEAGYSSGGISSDTGVSTTTFVFRVSIADFDNTAPAAGYPKVHIKKGGSEITGSPFAMNYDLGGYSTGAVYSYSRKLSTGTDYTYYFEAYDIIGATAAGSPTSTSDAPDVFNAAPIFSWTGESGYASDGVDPDTGLSTMTFTYRVVYTDVEKEDPSAGYPKVHIKKGGSGITGSPFAMNYVSGVSSSGALYTYSGTLSTGTDYTYYFEAYDIAGSTATGSPVSATDAPDVTDIPAAVLCDISGYIRNASNAPIAGVTVNLSGNGISSATVTDALGYYLFSGLPAGSYTVTPVKQGYNFVPPDFICAPSGSLSAVTGDFAAAYTPEDTVKPAGLHFGAPSAVKKKIRELKEKIDGQ